MPIILPKQAPTAIDGTKIPQGTLQPYEMMMKPIRMMVANKSELTIFHCSDDLFISYRTTRWMGGSLAKTVMITSALAFSEQQRHHFGHVYTQESVQVTNDGRYHS
jgi:hypothetical protein